MAIEISAQGKGVSVITLAGHDTGNFVYTQDLLDLAKVLTSCASDKELRALVITGRNNTFCGGRVGAKGLTRASEVAEDLNAILNVNAAINALSVPVIAAIEGQAFGFGFGITAQVGLCGGGGKRGVLAAGDVARPAAADRIHLPVPLRPLQARVRTRRHQPENLREGSVRSRHPDRDRACRSHAEARAGSRQSDGRPSIQRRWACCASSAAKPQTCTPSI